ncbi:MAG: hypothetical protein MUF73_07650 [Rhodobacteraceae bacterium]|jgi:hypothetical protein|nr:hypothetical protein [Paracoccaceae bacterium]
MSRAILTVVSLVVFGLPMAMVSLWALGMQDRWEEVLGGERNVPTGLAGAGRAVNDWVADAREGQIAAALFDPVAITDHRHVQFRRTGVTVADVLAPGEAEPAPDYAHLWITARGLALAQREGCPAILDTIATRCSAGMLDVEPADDGTFVVEARLGYAPADDLGPVPDNGRGVGIDRTTLRLPLQGSLSVAPDQVAAAERTLLTAAQDACRALRADAGTCTIQSLRFDRQPRGETVSLSAAVTLASLVPDGTTVTTDATEAAVEGGIMDRLRGLMGGDDTEAAPATGSPPRVLQGGGARNDSNTFSVD